jgi:hypothetical protein
MAHYHKDRQEFREAEKYVKQWLDSCLGGAKEKEEMKAILRDIRSTAMFSE